MDEEHVMVFEFEERQVKTAPSEAMPFERLGGHLARIKTEDVLTADIPWQLQTCTRLVGRICAWPDESSWLICEDDQLYTLLSREGVQVYLDGQHPILDKPENNP
jgi:hypothetical protein